MKLPRALLPRAGDVLAVAAMAVLFGIQFHPLLTERMNLAAFQDTVFMLGPIFHHVAETFRHGEYPYWMDSLVGGLPLYDSPQFSLTYPFYFLGSRSYAEPLTTMFWLHRLALAHIFVLQVNTFVLLRVLRVSVAGAALGATILAFSPNMVDFAGWTNSIAPNAWLPLVLAGFLLVADEDRRALGILVGGVAIALLALASPAHTLIHVVFLGAVFQGWNVARLWRAGRRRAIVTTSAGFVAMGVLALLLSAPGVLPMMIDKDRMIRFGAEDGTVRFEEFLHGEQRPWDLAAALLPLEVPVVTGRSFVGMGAALLALFGIRAAPRRWFVAPLALVGVYALLSAAGRHLGFAYVNYALPLMNLIREPPRHLVLFVIAVSILAAVGYDFLEGQIRDGRRVLADRAGLLTLVVFGLLLALAFAAPVEYISEIDPLRFHAVCLAGVVLLVAACVLRRSPGVLALRLGALGVAVASMQYPLQVPRSQDGDYFKAENLEAHETLRALAELPDAREYRFVFDGGALNEQFWSMNAAYYGLRNFQAYMNPLPRLQFEEVFGRGTLPHYYPLLGARYHVCERCDASTLVGYRLLREINSQKVYVSDRAVPHYALVWRVAGTFDDAGAFFARVDEDFDFPASAYLHTSEAAAVTEWLASTDAPPRYRIKEEARTPNRLTLSVASDRPTVLLLNEYYTTNWKAKVNNAAAPLHRINLNQIGVCLEQGSNLVTFEYRPTLFVLLLQVQRASAVLLAAYLLYRLAAHARHAARAPAP